MKTVNVHEAKTHLSKLLARVEKGEDVVIARDGKPIARLTAVLARTRPKSGFDKGLIWMSEDCFAPLTEEEMKDWEGDS